MATPVRKRTLLWDWTSTRDKLAYPPLPEGQTPIKAVHNWNTWVPPDLPAHIPFRPMFRTLQQLDFPEFEYAKSQPYEVMHFLNEPERQGITPDKAVEEWLGKIVPLRKERGCKIVGPACASDAAGTAWLDSFMALLKEKEGGNEMPDFLGLHYYGPVPEAAIAYFKERHAKYPDHQVNISEVACISRDPGEVWKFSKEVVEWAERTEWVEEIGLFGMMKECADDFVSPCAQLMDKEGGLTDLGKWWMGL